MFSISGENLTSRMRKDAFEAMLAQEMGWYDMTINNTGEMFAFVNELKSNKSSDFVLVFQMNCIKN